MPDVRIALVDVWRDPVASMFFRNVWPLYVHEISGFDTDFFTLDASGRWQPDIVEDWVAGTTPARNLRDARARDDSGQPFQRAHVIAVDGRAVGFVCVGSAPFKHMPEDADHCIAEFFVTHPYRGRGVAKRALERVLERRPGRWHLGVIHDNARALAFWRKALPAAGVRDLEERSVGRDVLFRFIAGR